MNEEAPKKILSKSNVSSKKENFKKKSSSKSDPKQVNIPRIENDDIFELYDVEDETETPIEILNSTNSEKTYTEMKTRNITESLVENKESGMMLGDIGKDEGSKKSETHEFIEIEEKLEKDIEEEIEKNFEEEIEENIEYETENEENEIEAKKDVKNEKKEDEEEEEEKNEKEEEDDDGEEKEERKNEKGEEEIEEVMNRKEEEKEKVEKKEKEEEIEEVINRNEEEIEEVINRNEEEIEEVINRNKEDEEEIEEVINIKDEVTKKEKEEEIEEVINRNEEDEEETEEEEIEKLINRKEEEKKIEGEEEENYFIKLSGKSFNDKQIYEEERRVSVKNIGEYEEEEEIIEDEDEEIEELIENEPSTIKTNAENELFDSGEEEIENEEEVDENIKDEEEEEDDDDEEGFEDKEEEQIEDEEEEKVEDEEEIEHEKDDKVEVDKKKGKLKSFETILEKEKQEILKLKKEESETNLDYINDIADNEEYMYESSDIAYRKSTSSEYEKNDDRQIYDVLMQILSKLEMPEILKIKRSFQLMISVPEVEEMINKVTETFPSEMQNIQLRNKIMDSIQFNINQIIKLSSSYVRSDLDLPLFADETIPLSPSGPIDFKKAKISCTPRKKFGPFNKETFLDLTQPPDTPDAYNELDVMNSDFETSCIIPPLSSLFKEGELDTKVFNKNPLSLEQCIGQVKELPVINLCSGDALSIFYACCHCGVVLDVEKNNQQLLQGHANAISCLTSSLNKKFLFIGDRGPNSRVNVWNVADEGEVIPVKTISHVDSHGVAAIAVSDVGHYLAVVSAGRYQSLCVWNWTEPSTTPLYEMKIEGTLGFQKYLIFNSENNKFLVSNSFLSVVFYYWNESDIESFSHSFSTEERKAAGEITATVFLRNNSIAISATSFGKFILWEKFKPVNTVSSKPFYRLDKIVRMQAKGITVLTTIKQFIVTGDVAGQIKFYDESLKLVNWIQDVKLGAITTISFDFSGDYGSDAPEDSLDLDLILSKDTFSSPNFVFGTSSAVIVYVTNNGNKMDVIQNNFGCIIASIDVHPSKPLIALSGTNGLLRLINYKDRQSVASKLFDEGKTPVSCIKFNLDGSILAVGFANGKIEIVHGLNLQKVYKGTLNDSNSYITHIEFSHNFQFMASADVTNAVTMYLINRERLWTDDEKSILFLGRYKAHNKLIRNILFKYKHIDESYRFFSVSFDRTLVEYEFSASKQGLSVKSVHVIEHSALPMYMKSYPSLTKENLLLMCNNQYKFKLINTSTKMVRKTLLGPAFGSPVEKFVVSSITTLKNQETYFIACIINSKICISLLPLTGSHYRSFCLVSHPNGVKDLVVSPDGAYLFSSGGSSLMIWSVNILALQMQEKLMGNEMQPFYEQIEGGKNGAFMYQLENLFCYAQLKNQGIDTQDMRMVGEKVNVSELPSLMRALGYYPSEKDAYQMMMEVCFSLNTYFVYSEK